jgi:hypothetical protein
VVDVQEFSLGRSSPVSAMFPMGEVWAAGYRKHVGVGRSLPRDGKGAKEDMPGSGDQHDVIEFLSDPASYGCDERIERIDTHAAMIFLAGDRAYKLKRAIRLPYLDFSTVAKRRKVCESELKLNRRTAPDLYIEVRSIGRTSDGSLAFGKGRPVDWLVVMKRFPPECLLDTMVRSGPLDSALTRQLAHAIAAFHS